MQKNFVQKGQLGNKEIRIYGDWRGRGSASFQWWKSWELDEKWTTLGTDSSQSLRMGTKGFYWILRVIKDDKYGVATKWVNYGVPPKGPGLGKENANQISENATPDKFALHPNYPNPFNPSTTIRFDIPAIKQASNEVQIQVYNLLGQRVTTPFRGHLRSGAYEIRWHAINDQGIPLPSGVYIYTIQSNLFHSSKKMILMR